MSEDTLKSNFHAYLMSLMGRRVARMWYIGSKHRPTRLTESRTKSNLKKKSHQLSSLCLLSPFLLLSSFPKYIIRFRFSVMMLKGERTYMFQNLLMYLMGPSAMTLRMFSTMYTERKHVMNCRDAVDSPYH